MALSLSEYQKRTDEELIAEHDGLAKMCEEKITCQMIRDELDLREQKRINGSIKCMTLIMTIMTGIILICTAVQVTLYILN